MHTITVYSRNVHCDACGEPIPPGHKAVWPREGGGVFHPQCAGRPWFSVVTFSCGATPQRIGRGVSQNRDECVRRAAALRQAHCPTVRVVQCRTRKEAREADISDSYPVVYHG